MSHITQINIKDQATGRRSLVAEHHFEADRISFLSEEGIGIIGQTNVKGLCMRRFKGDLQTSGLDYSTLVTGIRLNIGGASIEITQIGKPCHAEDCPAFSWEGTCVMLHETMFGKVVESGTVQVNDRIEVV